MPTHLYPIPQQSYNSMYDVKLLLNQLLRSRTNASQKGLSLTYLQSSPFSELSRLEQSAFHQIRNYVSTDQDNQFPEEGLALPGIVEQIRDRAQVDPKDDKTLQHIVEISQSLAVEMAKYEQERLRTAKARAAMTENLNRLSRLIDEFFAMTTQDRSLDTKKKKGWISRFVGK